jgi:hypothetical protein
MAALGYPTGRYAGGGKREARACCGCREPRTLTLAAHESRETLDAHTSRPCEPRDAGRSRYRDLSRWPIHSQNLGKGIKAVGEMPRHVAQ